MRAPWATWTGLMRDQALIRSRCVPPAGVFAEFPAEAIDRPIPDRFEDRVRRHPERRAVDTRDRSLTYAELNEAANRLAHALLDRGDPADGGVGLLFGNEAALVVASIGALKAGRLQVVLDCGVPRARLAFMVAQSGCTTLVTSSEHLALAGQVSPVPVLNVDELDGSLPVGNPGRSVSPEAPVAVAYTSGSTGSPKGIVWNHRGVLHAVRRQTNTFFLGEQDRLLMFRPGVRGPLYALLNGATFHPADLHRDGARAVADWMVREGTTVLRAPVSAFRALAGSLGPGGRYPRLRLILLYGEPVYPADVALYRERFPGAGVLGGTLGCGEFDDYACFFVEPGSALGKGAIPGGYLMGDTEILLLGEDGCPVASGDPGEIAIRSRYNAVGYWRRPDLTAAAFLPDPAGGDARLYRTGDVGRISPDGCLFHLGRTDFQVKILGHRVDVAEVEAALRELPQVEEAAVVGLESESGETRLVAYLRPADAAAPTVGDLRRALEPSFPDYMVPSTYVVLEAFPRTATGKIDRRALPPPGGLRPVLGTPFVAPRTPVESRLAAVWADVLRIDRVGVHDGFLELGGDSLLAMRVIARVIDDLRLEVPHGSLLAAATVAEMADAVLAAAAGQLAASAAGPSLPRAEAPPSTEA